MTPRRSPTKTTARAIVPAIALALAVLSAQATAADAAATGAGEEGDASQDAPYVDRVIDPGALPDMDEAAEAQPYDASGLPRSFNAELAYSHGEFGDDRYREYGISAGGHRESARWGTWSLQASVSRRDDDRDDPFGSDGSDGDWTGSATLWQRNLAMPGQWRGDNGAGVLNTPSVPLQREQYRFFLPSTTYAGLSSEWSNAATGLRLQGGGGRLGHYTGTRLLGFETDEGHVGTLGAQWQWASGWTGSATWLSSDGRLVAGDAGQPVIEDGRSHAVHAATAWQGERDRMQLNLLSSGGDAGDARGGWLDARSERGRYTHNYGAFHLGEGLAWGSYPINNDTRGGYYRIGYQFARWSWSAGVDRIESISGDSFDGNYATAYARYQHSSTLGYGGTASLRDGEDRALATQWFLDKRSDWGTTRLQWDTAHVSGEGADSWQASIDQAFPVRAGSRLSATVAYGELAYDGEPATRTSSFALYGGQDLTDRLSIDGQLRWTHGDGPGALRGSNANIAVNWVLNPRWSLTASLYQNQGTQRSPFELDPLGQDPLFMRLPRERSAFLVLRYQRDAGRARAVIGGAPGAATGQVAGSVFLDGNDDGSRNASEAAVPNLTVILDGRYAVRTDSQGRFEFQDVAVGEHRLTVVADNLPLPWFIDEAQAERSIEVRVRESLQVEIPAARAR